MEVRGRTPSSPRVGLVLRALGGPCGHHMQKEGQPWRGSPAAPGCRAGLNPSWVLCMLTCLALILYVISRTSLDPQGIL